MKTVIEKIKNLIPTRRRIIQLYTAVLYNVNVKGFVSGKIYKGDSKNICVPGLNCYSCPGAVGACPLGSLQGSYSAGRSTFYYVIGTLVLYGILLGRIICGWLCPFGLIQELLYKIKTPKVKKGKITYVLSFFKYVLLVFFIGIVPLMYAFKDTPLPPFCKYICPAGTLEGGILLLANKANDSNFEMLGPLFTWKFLLMVSFIVACVFIFRLFCRFICPLGALYGLFNKFSFFGVHIDKSKCTNCNLCVAHCKMDIKKPGDHECISCGDCVKVCPTKAIEWKGPKFINESMDTDVNADKNKKLRKITRLISTIILVLLLVVLAIKAWNTKEDEPDIEITNQSSDLDIPVGNEIGNLCPGYDLNIITKDEITTETINPATTKKITIINFWGTWCNPCVNELPYFDKIATEYKDDVTVIAIHTQMINDTAPEFISKNYNSSNIIFASDVENEGYCKVLGGGESYPYTIILDENGVILYKIVSALEYEDLKEYVETQLNKE